VILRYRPTIGRGESHPRRFAPPPPESAGRCGSRFACRRSRGTAAAGALDTRHRV